MKPFPIFLEVLDRLPVPRPAPFISKPFDAEIQARINLLVVVDNKIDYLPLIERALELQNKDYLVGTDGELEVRHTIIRQDLSGLPWSEYWGNNYGVNGKWIAQETKSRIGLDAYSIAYVIDDSNWTFQGNQNIYGWHIGLFNGFQVQLIRGVESADWLSMALLMEAAHSWDDLYERETGRQIEDLFGVADYDEDVIHGRTNPPWVPYQYVPVFKVLKQFLVNYFKIKNMRYAIDKNNDQYLLYDPLKIAISIGDEVELKKLQDRGLIDTPQQIEAETLAGYWIISGIEKSRLKDIFNL